MLQLDPIGMRWLQARLIARCTDPRPLAGVRGRLRKLGSCAHFIGGADRMGIMLRMRTLSAGFIAPCRHACKLGLEGIVSQRLGSPYRSGRSRDWVTGSG